VAIKIPTDPQYVRNLQREGAVVHGLRHPNIVRAIDMDPYADPPYLVMEYVDGPPLRAAIDQYKSNFPIAAVVAILRGTLNGLAAAHGAGLVHRDLKPENILLAEPLANLPKIAEQSVKVTDFGLGAVNGATTNSMLQSGSLDAAEANRLAGTIAYMSPEQRDGESLDGRSDLYSCGILLFEMLTGERPQGTELPSALRRGLSVQFDEVFRRAYTRKDRRFNSAAEMAGALSVGVAGSRGVSTGTIETSRGMTCPACNGAVHRDDQFCIHCGRQLVAVIPRCRSCDAYVHPSDRFCIACGKDLGVLA